MPVLATPTSSRIVTRDEIRRWLRDYPPGLVPGTGVMNILLEGVEFSDADLDAGLQGAVDRYNVITPFTLLGLDQIPRALLFYGSAAYLLQSESFRQQRNQATVQAADVQPIGIDDKAPLYAQMSTALWGKFDELCRAIKTQRNMESMFGHLSSGYSNVSRTLYG